MTTARCNPLWQPIPCPLSDIEGLESWLGDMAAQGPVSYTHLTLPTKLEV